MPEDNTIPSYEEQQAARAAAAQQGQQEGDWTTISVYTGRSGPRPQFDSDQTGQWAIPGTKQLDPQGNPIMDYERVTAGQLANQWYTMDAVERNRYKDTFILMGIINPQRATDQDYSSIWLSYVQQLAKYNAAQPNSMLTIGDLITGDLQKKEMTDPGLSELMRTGKRTTTRTSTNLQKSSALDARALMDAAARTLLGRRATDEESAQLLSAVNELETANPEVTTTTQEEDMYGQILNQSSTTSGGVSAASREQIAREKAEANPEFGAYQASTTYMGALMDMVYGRGY